jgi:HK97 family phage major capsid protein
VSDYINRQVQERARAFESAKALLDNAAAEKRDLNAEESAQYAAMNADIDARGLVISQMLADEKRDADIRSAVAGHVEARPEERAPEVRSDADLIRSLARGEMRSLNFERRDLTKGGTTGAPVPTSFYDTIIEVARYTGPMLDTSTVLNTAGGESLQIPRTNAYSSATVIGEASAISESDPTFQAFLTLNAYKYSFLVQVSLEMIEDAGVDLLGYMGTNVGQALGLAVNAGLTTGTGTTQPTGIVTSAGSGITGGTGVSGAFTTNNVIDLVYSTDNAVRRLPGFGIMGGATAMAAARKLQDGNGSYVWQPSLQAGQPDRLLGYAVFENPSMAAVATSAKSLIAGDLKSYIVRQVGGIRLDRSDDYAFADGLVTFRAIFRVDGGLPQAAHVKTFAGGAS